MKPLADQQQPSGLLRWSLRVPILLYRLHLGWLLGSRFVMLTHRGRKTGKPRYAVVEAMHYDAASDTFYVGSGWGEKSDWYRNVMQNPAITLQIGGRQYAAMAERLDDEAARRILVDYERSHPAAFRILVRALTGERFDGREESLRKVVCAMPVMALRVRPGGGGERQSA